MQKNLKKKIKNVEMAEMFFEDKYVTDCDVVFLIEIMISCNWEAGFLVALYDSPRHTVSPEWSRLDFKFLGTNK